MMVCGAAGAARMWKGAAFVVLTVVLLGATLGADARAGLFQRNQGSEVQASIEARLATGMPDQLGDIGDSSLETLQVLRKLYAAGQYSPLWLTDGGVGSRARELISALQGLKDDGLVPEDYMGSEIAEAGRRMSPDEIADLDIRLTLGVAQAAMDLGSGRLVASEVDPDVFVHQDEVDRNEVLQAALKASDIKEFLLSFRPQQDNYRRLRLALMRYRAFQEQGGWKPIPDGQMLRKGVSDPRVPYLRWRLALVEDLPRKKYKTKSPEIFDRTVQHALINFQKRHGLLETGEVDAATLAALNMPVEARIQQIIANLERRRWMPDQWEDRYVFVNLANFELKVVDDGKTIHVTEVVVGALHHRTRVFSDMIRYLVFNPYWNVPNDIAAKEFMPALKKEADPSWLAERGYEVINGWHGAAKVIDPRTVNWASVPSTNFGYRFRQVPGDNNSLGRVKFMFPNKHSIYMHDTPAKELFNRNERAFSHGCIRVKDPLKLASVLLHWQDGWSRSKIDDTVAAGKQRVVSLEKPIPVHLYYVTAWANKDGSVHFRSDIYGRDKLLGYALFGSANLL